MLICTVRDCGAPLIHLDRRVACSNGHSFDIARSGYINLLQPQDRRSRQPGDAREAVAARRRLHDRGFTAPLFDGVTALLGATARDVVLDAGCGDGFYLGSLESQTRCRAHGIDISIPAIDAAARRYRSCEWVVANADRLIPYADASFSIVVSITGRMNATEFRRVLHRGGRLLVAVPAPNDLIELRGVGRHRAERTAGTFAEEFRLIAQQQVTTSAELDAPSVEDVLLSIYRPLQSKPSRSMRLTLSLDLLLFSVR